MNGSMTVEVHSDGASTTVATANGVVNGNAADNEDYNTDLAIFGRPEEFKRPVDDTDYHRAVGIVTTRLGDFAPMKVLFEVNFGGGHPTLLIDARKDQPAIVMKAEEKPTGTVSIRPETIDRIIQGQFEPRYGMNFGQIGANGAPWVAIKFGDYLAPKHLQPKSPPKPPTDLPVPTEDLAQVRRDLKAYGYGLIKNALKPDQIATLQGRLKQQADAEVREGVSYHDGGPGAPNQRVWNLPFKGQEFLDLLEHPIIDEFVPEMIGDNYVFSSYSANIARPGSIPMFMHCDQLPINPPIRDISLGVNIMWFLTEMTEENGGTRILPQSQAKNLAPDDMFDYSGTIPATGPAGTALIFDSRLWHATGAYTKPDGERPVLLLYFVRYFVRPQENSQLSMTDEFYDNLTDRVKTYMGYRVTGTLGMSGGFVHDGTMVRQVHRPLGVMK